MTTIDAEPIEGPGTELSKVMAEGDPETLLAQLEKKAELAPRWNKAINTILDRAYGKPSQPIDGDGEGGPVNMSVTVKFIKPQKE